MLGVGARREQMLERTTFRNVHQRRKKMGDPTISCEYLSVQIFALIAYCAAAGEITYATPIN